MFEFHVTGATLFYDGSRFARDGVACVTIKDRVGAEGFLHLGDGVANLGLLGQIAALEWRRWAATPARSPSSGNRPAPLASPHCRRCHAPRGCSTELSSKAGQPITSRRQPPANPLRRRGGEDGRRGAGDRRDFPRALAASEGESRPTGPTVLGHLFAIYEASHFTDRGPLVSHPQREPVWAFRGLAWALDRDRREGSICPTNP
jgi:hypothetical protein